MAISLSAYNKGSFFYSFSEDNSQSKDVNSDAITSSYTYGSGVFKANVAFDTTGLLPSGGGITFDLTSLQKDTFGTTGIVSFSGVKFISVINNSVVNTGIWGTGQTTFSGWDFTVTTTGVTPISGLFNESSGNLQVRPYSYFSYNDPYGDLRTSETHKNLQLNDSGGSGALYSISILGDLQ